MKRFYSAAIALTLILAACAIDEPTGQTLVPTGQPNPADTPLAMPDAMVELARQDLADKIDVPTADIEARAVTAVSWPDAALDCPMAGQVYAQIETPGYRILLQVGDEVYEYRTDELGNYVHCQGGQPVE